jgi:hypothetical protein
VNTRCSLRIFFLYFPLIMIVSHVENCSFRHILPPSKLIAF